MKSKENTSKTLHLVLKSKWYDKIASGEKTSEYRKCSHYWNKRLGGIDTKLGHVYDMLGIAYKHKKEYYSVVFHRGYTNKTMEFAITSIDIITGKPNDLGLFQCWEIKLGQRITKGDNNE